MYQIFSHISRMTSGTLPHPGTEGVKTTQLSDKNQPWANIHPDRDGKSLRQGQHQPGGQLSLREYEWLAHQLWLQQKHQFRLYLLWKWRQLKWRQWLFLR